MGQDNGLSKKRSRSNEKSVELVVANEAKQIQQQEKVIASEDNQKPKKQQQQQGNPKKKKSQESYPFGNYKNYYGYRISNDMDEDPRLKVLKKEWFQGKDCLDIGCNNGIMTIHIANKFGFRSTLGVDIDSSRIGDAQWHLRNFVRKQNHAKPGGGGEIKTGSAETKDLFQIGGIFVMEPQTWKSYEKNRRVSETTAMNHRTIVLRPEHFQEILLDKIGFSTVEDLTLSLSGARKGFDRQILAFQK
ncbi:hypothetical protein N665_0100s0023 [Sinapis alba]|nr:hypothetical protein N665_0100s0023 [Sinapis alba]